MSAVTPSASTFARVGRGALDSPRRARPAFPAPRRGSRVVFRRKRERHPGEEEEDDLPPPIKLTADQARIAALAFEVLYEKDPVEEMEEMLVDRERPGLRLKLQQAIKGAARSSPRRPSSSFFPFTRDTKSDAPPGASLPRARRR